MSYFSLFNWYGPNVLFKFHLQISSIGHTCFLFKKRAPKTEQMPAQHKCSWHFFMIVFWISSTAGEMLKVLLEFLLAHFGPNPKYLYEEIQWGIWFLIWSTTMLSQCFTCLLGLVGTVFVIQFLSKCLWTPFPCENCDWIHLPFIEFDRVSASD